jgi:hypothetical protein
MNSDSPAFGSSLFITFSFSGDFSRSGRSSAMHPLQINSLGPLRDFNTFQPRQDQQPSVPFLINGRDSTSGIRHFHPLLSSGVLCTHSSRSGAMRPFMVDDCDSLRDFDVQEVSRF